MSAWSITIFKRMQLSFDLTVFFRQLATLISSGIPLIQACDMLEKSQTKSDLRLLVFNIKRDLLAGKSLSACLQPHAFYFTEMTQQLVRIGEQTGKLDQTLLIIANHAEKNLHLQQRIRQALFYPSILLCISFSITLCLFLFVVPKFAELFNESENQLPILTLILFRVSACLRSNGYYLLAPVALLLMCLVNHPYAQASRLFLQSHFFNIPFVKRLLQKIWLVRFARNLALTFAAGIPITNGLTLLRTSSTSAPTESVINTLIQQVSSGRQLHDAMIKSAYFPSLMLQMVKVGEESGKLSDMLVTVADLMQADFDQLVMKFSQLLEPLIMVVLGVLIGGLVIGMYLPIFKLGNTL